MKVSLPRCGVTMTVTWAWATPTTVTPFGAAKATALVVWLVRCETSTAAVGTAVNVARAAGSPVTVTTAGMTSTLETW